MADSIPNTAEGASTTAGKGDEEELFSNPDKFAFLVCGKTGIGKSSIINSLVGSDVCRVSDPGDPDSAFEIGTTDMKAEKVRLHGVPVYIWDSPGLQDGLTENDDDEKYLQQMAQACGERMEKVSVILYCIDMTIARWTPPEVIAIKHLTERFGEAFWRKCVIVMTKGNMVHPREGKPPETYCKTLYANFLRRLRNELIKNNMPKEVAEAVPGVVAGLIATTAPEQHQPVAENCPENPDRYLWYVSDQVTETKPAKRHDFLPEMWVVCFNRMDFKSRDKFWEMAGRNRIRPKHRSKEWKKLEKILEEKADHDRKLESRRKERKDRKMRKMRERERREMERREREYWEQQRRELEEMEAYHAATMLELDDDQLIRVTQRIQSDNEDKVSSLARMMRYLGIW